MNMSPVEPSFSFRSVRAAMFACACFVVLPIAACKGQNPEDVRMSTPNPAGVEAEAPVADALPLRSLNVSPPRAYEIRVSLSSFGNVGCNSTGQKSDFVQGTDPDFGRPGAGSSGTGGCPRQR